MAAEVDRAAAPNVLSTYQIATLGSYRADEGQRPGVALRANKKGD